VVHHPGVTPIKRPGDDFELIDAGAGRRLERFGDYLVDRAHPAAIVSPEAPDLWRDADLTFNRVALSPATGAAMTATATQVNAEAQTATFTFAGMIAPGRYRLAIDYAGKINAQANGLFALDYTDGATQKRALFTQFEAPDARRMFPSWDEPQFRTPYDLSVVVPHGQFAIGNMPIASRAAQANGADLVTFGTTPAMSSYLLFLGTGDLERITQRAGNTEVGVVSRRGTAEQGRWALTSAARILPYYNDYFGTPFPLPKLDNIAGPGSSAFFGAMENWGAIFTFESILLDDPALTSESRRRSIFSVAAHEMAHQWFGDLVTMAWWDDLWLNEGFASWMESKATASLHPEWETLVDRVGGVTVDIDTDVIVNRHGTPVVLMPQGPRQPLTGAQALDLLGYRAAGEDEVEALPRVQNVLVALLQKLPTGAGPVSALASDLGAGSRLSDPQVGGAVLDGFHRDIGADRSSFQILPVLPIDGGGAASYRIDAARVTALSRGPLAGSRLAGHGATGNRVLVLNQAGGAGLGQQVRDRIVPRGFAFVDSRNQTPFGRAQTMIVVFDRRPDTLARATRLAAALGLPHAPVQVSERGQTIADLIVIVGTDFRP